MVGHYGLMNAITVIALFLFVMIAAVQSSGNSLDVVALLTKAYDMVYANSELITLAVQLLTVGAVVLIFFITRSLKKDEAPSANKYFSLKKVSPTVLLMSALLAFCAYFTVNAFITGVGYLFPDLLGSYNDAMEGSYGNANLILQFLTVVIGAPVCEELIYRNMALTNMNKRLSPILSVTISAAIFGLVHGTPLQIVYAGALGFVFGILFVRSESIFPSLVAHAVFNAMGFGLPILADAIKEGSTAETVFNIVIAILSVATNLAAPLVFWWVFKHTDRPLCVKKRKEKKATASAGYANPYQTPHYTTRPQGNYGYQPYMPPQYQAPPPGWVFDPRYGWIYIGANPYGQPGQNMGTQNPQPNDTAPADSEHGSDTTEQ